MRFIRLCALAALGRALHAQAAPATGTPATPPPHSVAAQTADSVRYSRRDAIASALARNPLLDVAREQTAQARARKVEATTLPDPQLDAELDNQEHFLSGSQGIPVSLGLTVTNPLKLKRAGRVADADILNNEQNFRLQVQTLAVQTSQAYDQLLASLAHQRDHDSALVAATDFRIKTQARFDAGIVKKFDVTQATADEAQARTDSMGDARDISNARIALNKLMGRQIGSPIIPTDSLAIPVALPDSATVEQMALTNRPELGQAEAQQQGAQASIALTKSFWFPDVTFSVSRDYVAPGSPLLSTALTMPIPFYWQHEKGDIAEAQHHALELAASTRDVRATVLQDVRTAYVTAATAIKQALFIRDALLPSFAEEYRVALTTYQLGGSSALDVIQARKDLIAAQTQLTDALTAALSARADLERALGSSPDRFGAIAP